MTAASTLSMPLRPYQVEARRAVLESVSTGAGRSFSIEVARQGGKNELSAHLELELLLRHRGSDVTLIKAAPTFEPQARISLERLWSRMQDAGLTGQASRENGNSVRLGRARQLFLSAEPGSNVVGHTADLLLEIDEAQDVDQDKFDKEFAPMAAARAATTVFYGTAWDDAGLLERMKQKHLAQERRDGIRRHFEYDWHAVAASNSGLRPLRRGAARGSRRGAPAVPDPVLPAYPAGRGAAAEPVAANAPARRPRPPRWPEARRDLRRRPRYSR